MSFLLDTNVVSELRKPRPDQRVRAWADGTPIRFRFLSVLVLAEVRGGIERTRHRGDISQAAVLESWLARLRRVYAGGSCR